MALGLCYGPRPGEGSRAAAEYARAAPVVAALAAYRAGTGAYPVTLDSLAPRFIAAAALRRAVYEGPYPLEYEQLPNAFVLRFRYTHPGMNVCEYTPASARWHCSGYY